MTLALSIQDLSISTSVADGSKLLVDSVSMSLERGQIIGIVGESGSGKTLITRAMTGLLAPNLYRTGRIDITAGSTGQTPRIRLLMQDPFTMLNPLLTIGETIRESLPRSLTGSLHKTSALERLEEVGLTPDVADLYPFQLSGGMLQRAALAAALAGEPDILLADEPTTALDSSRQREVLDLLAKLQKERNLTLVIVTHDLQMAFAICHTIAVAYAGSIVELAPAETIREAPRHPYTVGLLKSNLPTDHYETKLFHIPGRVPNAEDVQKSCAFSNRCIHTIPACTVEKPPLRSIAMGHETACIRVEDIAWQKTSATPKDHGGERPQMEGDVCSRVRIDGLFKSYRTGSLLSGGQQRLTLKDISLTIGANENVGLVGESGSGKTTLARILTGMTDFDAGSIRMEDEVYLPQSMRNRTQVRAMRRACQMVFQDPYSSLNPSLRIGVSIEEAFRLNGADGQTVQDLLKRVGLPEHYADRYPSQLSGGERQRVAIARAIAAKPKLLICDEPVAALDVSVQAHVLSLLRELREEEDISMLFITHDLAVLRQITDRAAVIYHGELVETGPTDHVLDDPQHAYTQALIKASYAR